MRNGNSFDEVGDRFEVKLLDKSKHLREHHLEMVGKFQEKIAALEAERDALKAEVEKLKAKTAMSLGVGDGSGQLFVHGDYDSINACQAKLLELEKLRIETDALKARIDKAETVIDLINRLREANCCIKNTTTILDIKTRWEINTLIDVEEIHAHPLSPGSAQFYRGRFCYKTYDQETFNNTFKWDVWEVVNPGNGFMDHIGTLLFPGIATADQIERCFKETFNF